MKTNKKQLITWFIKAVTYIIFLFGLYIADRIYPSLFLWFTYYEPSGIQYLLILFFSLPVFIIVELIILFCRKCHFSKSMKYLPLIAILFVILPVIFDFSASYHTRIIGSIGAYIVTLVVLGFFFYEVCGIKQLWKYLKTNQSQKLYITVTVLILSLGIFGILSYKNIVTYFVHYSKYNTAWHTGFSNLTQQEKYDLLVNIFTDRHFDINKARKATYYTFNQPIKTNVSSLELRTLVSKKSDQQQELQKTLKEQLTKAQKVYCAILNRENTIFIKHLIAICNDDLVKLSVLDHELSNFCYKDILDMTQISLNKNIDEKLSLYVANNNISRSEKLQLIWKLINSHFPPSYDSCNNLEMRQLELLMKYFFSFKPQEYQVEIIEYINACKSDCVKIIVKNYYKNLVTS